MDAMQMVLKVYAYMTIKVIAFEAACREVMGTNDASEKLIKQYSLGVAHGAISTLETLGLPVPKGLHLALLHEQSVSLALRFQADCPTDWAGMVRSAKADVETMSADEKVNASMPTYGELLEEASLRG